MTVEEVLDACHEHRLIIHRGQVFINVRNPEEAEYWRKRDCAVREWHSQWELRRGATQGWEVGLLGACDKVWVADEEGDEINVTQERLLAAARARLAASSASLPSGPSPQWLSLPAPGSGSSPSPPSSSES